MKATELVAWGNREPPPGKRSRFNMLQIAIQLRVLAVSVSIPKSYANYMLIAGKLLKTPVG